ncbi:RNA 2',3'-cyclic phosphodiesterase [Ramlibacter sp. PS4R-6]|uniref:RNA 2',3'-cyclic phosphodiesterase n=1 Tax=Ramlibacter sp. PS4R-6 TaxID=3133438 RepID=UPI0030A4C70A
MRAPATVRLFIALWPPEPVREAIALWQAQWQWPQQATLVKAERLHATLHFLGDVAPERVLDLKYVLDRVAAQGFALHFGHPDMWQHGTAVLRPENSPTALRGLHARIGLALAEIGLPVEGRSYRPHVTLARRAQGAKPPAEMAAIDWESKGGFVLVQTLGGGRGYQVLETFGNA